MQTFFKWQIKFDIVNYIQKILEIILLSKAIILNQKCRKKIHVEVIFCQPFLHDYRCWKTAILFIKYEDWIKSRLVPLPKKVNLHDLNNWIGINLSHVVSKVFSIILNARAQKLLKKNGYPMYFCTTTKVGFEEAVFSLIFFLQSGREHGIESHTIFIDLVKACNSIKHKVMYLTLKKMGAPDKHIKWAEKSHGDFN